MALDPSIIIGKEKAMTQLDNLMPREVFHWFYKLCSIPHGSGNTDEISNFLVEFASTRNLDYVKDKAGNVIIKKGGTSGFENSPTVILQGHIDMVAVCDDPNVDMTKKSLDLRVEDGQLYAEQTSLGGDDGIAVAYTLAILDSDNIPHPPLEALFTVGEEIGMIGATALDTSVLKGNILINIDSEDEGFLFVSCAGGVGASVRIPYTLTKTRAVPCTVSLTGLTGGHSGIDIDKGRGNAHVLMGRLLRKANGEHPFNIVSLSGGDKDNAIAINATAVIAVEKTAVADIKATLVNEFVKIRSEYHSTDPRMTVNFTEDKEEEINCMDSIATNRIISFLTLCPGGVQQMSPDIAGLVQTSLNMGILNTCDGAVNFGLAIRSSVPSQKDDLAKKIQTLSALMGGSCILKGDYPPWQYREHSPLRDTFYQEYKKLYNEAPTVLGMHAGLECGVFDSKIKNLDAVSFGPTMTGVHTTGERLDIASVERTYTLLLSVLKALK